ncbi:hypothetical protein Misp02_64670 [Microtetraspora sp. NBRC 16547]|nr:hypothetical protein Misp02_64670 [Microtetraspora sp. NBRC 16547]
MGELLPAVAGADDAPLRAERSVAFAPIAWGVADADPGVAARTPAGQIDAMLGADHAGQQVPGDAPDRFWGYGGVVRAPDGTP